MKTEDFYEILFDDGDHCCYAADLYGTTVYPVWADVRNRSEFFSLNALDGERDNDPVTDRHSEFVPRRADANVVKRRNFLVEMDTVPTLQGQADIIRRIGLPFTTAVFSGGKSIHHIISLTKPVSREEYSAIFAALEEVFLKAGVVIDGQCKNPSRLTRCANTTRKDKGRIQKLLKVGNRVDKWDLLKWLGTHGVFPGDEPEPAFSKISSVGTDSEMFDHALFLTSKKHQYAPGNHNNFVNYLAWTLHEWKMSEHEIRRRIGVAGYTCDGDPIRSVCAKERSGRFNYVSRADHYKQKDAERSNWAAEEARKYQISKKNNL